MRALWLFQQRPQQAATEFEEEIDHLTLGFGGGHFGEASREAVVLLALALAFEALSLEAQRAEADRIDLARANAVHQLDADRARLIHTEKLLRDTRARIAALEPPAAEAPSAPRAA